MRYLLGVAFFGLWFTGWISDIIANQIGWAAAGFVILPLGAVRGLVFLVARIAG
jgi:hypothetical protein